MRSMTLQVVVPVSGASIRAKALACGGNRHAATRARPIPPRTRLRILELTFCLVAATATLLASSTAHAAVTTYVATLEGAQQVPPVTTTRSGTATFDYDDVTRRLKGTVSVEGFGPTDVTKVVIERGACGAVDGGVVETLRVGDIGFGITLEEADGTQSLATGNLYVNIRTVAHPNGEIRGQLYPKGAAQSCGTGVVSSAGGIDGGGGGGGESGGCSTTGASSPSGSALMLAVATMGLAAMLASRRRKLASE